MKCLNFNTIPMPVHPSNQKRCLPVEYFKLIHSDIYLFFIIYSLFRILNQFYSCTIPSIIHDIYLCLLEFSICTEFYTAIWFHSTPSPHDLVYTRLFCSFRCILLRNCSQNLHKETVYLFISSHKYKQLS